MLTFYVTDRAVYLLMAYAKGDQTNPSAEQVRLLKRLIEDLF